MNDRKVIICGGAGLVGQNLVVRLTDLGYSHIVVLDKHQKNLELLSKSQANVYVEFADLAEEGNWQTHFSGAEVVVMLQAQIGGNIYDDFIRNNVTSTTLILDSVKVFKVPYLVHVSSSVVESSSDDFYTRSKKMQEDLVLKSGLHCSVLRPTLMFGWFDRKHLGWLSRFMFKFPIFPIPSHGKFMRQPLYVGDFCNIITTCIEARLSGGVYNISGREKVDYIEIIREIKRATSCKTFLMPIPYSVFFILIWLWCLFDKNPPFTTQQLKALVDNDEFEVIDWPTIFGVNQTPFKEAIDETFNDPRYSKVVLEF